LSLPLFGFNYADTAKGRAFINKMHRKYGFSKSYIREILSDARHMQDVLDRYNGKRKNADRF